MLECIRGEIGETGVRKLSQGTGIADGVGYGYICLFIKRSGGRSPAELPVFYRCCQREGEEEDGGENRGNEDDFRACWDAIPCLHLCERERLYFGGGLDLVFWMVCGLEL